jgi:hypothetical protein
MKKKIIIGFLVCVLITYIPIKLLINNYAQSSIKQESSKEWEYKVNHKDSVFSSIRDPRSGNYYCVLYHNMSSHFENLDTLSKDENGFLLVTSYETEYLRKHNIKIDKSTYFCKPNFNTYNVDFRELCKEIKNINESKGRDSYSILDKGNYQGWFQTGWAIGSMWNRNGYPEYMVSLIYPAIIELRNNSNNVGFINIALNDSYNFFTKSEDSEYTNCDKSQRLKQFMDFCLPNNESCYYQWVRKEGTYFRLIPQLQWTYLTNQFYNVHLGYSKTFQFELKLNEDYVERKTTEYKTELTSIQNIITLVLSVLLLLYLFILIIKSYSEKKQHKETILQRITKSAHPKQFIDNYDKVKLEIANAIYDKALKTDENDEEAIALLAKEIEEKLGLYLITKGEIKELRDRCNPKNFMKPYNAEKITKANTLYGDLQKENISFSRYVELRNEVEGLYS